MFTVLQIKGFVEQDSPSEESKWTKCIQGWSRQIFGFGVLFAIHIAINYIKFVIYNGVNFLILISSLN